MGKNYSFAATGQLARWYFSSSWHLPGSNNARLLSATQKDASLRNFFNAIFSRPIVQLRFANNL
jgi:hypothetical protein